MERPSHYRHWTAAEDEAIRLSAARGRPTLRALAGDSGRSYCAIRLRASRLRAIRLPRLDPAQRAARGPFEIPCRYCGSAFLSRGGARYCGGECRTLGRGQCPGCGRALKALQCARCAVEGKRAVWLGPSRIAGRALARARLPRLTSPPPAPPLAAALARQSTGLSGADGQCHAPRRPELAGSRSLPAPQRTGSEPIGAPS